MCIFPDLSSRVVEDRVVILAVGCDRASCSLAFGGHWGLRFGTTQWERRDLVKTNAGYARVSVDDHVDVQHHTQMLYSDAIAKAQLAFVLKINSLIPYR